MVTAERIVEIYAIAPVTSYEGLGVEELKEVAKTVGANLKGLRNCSEFRGDTGKTSFLILMPCLIVKHLISIES